jgi:hypothetical protein
VYADRRVLLEVDDNISMVVGDPQRILDEYAQALPNLL